MPGGSCPGLRKRKHAACTSEVRQAYKTTPRRPACTLQPMTVSGHGDEGPAGCWLCCWAADELSTASGQSLSSPPPLPAATQPQGCCEGQGVQQEAPSTSPPWWLLGHWGLCPAPLPSDSHTHDPGAPVAAGTAWPLSASVLGRGPNPPPPRGGPVDPVSPRGPSRLSRHSWLSGAPSV